MIQQRARATRESILAGAAAVFEKEGYGMASLARVAEEASVTKGALYFHFRSKDELARAVIAAQHARGMERSAAVVAEGRPPLESMILIIRGFGQDSLNEPIVRAGIRLTFEASAFGQDVAEPYRHWTEALESMTRTARDEGWLHAEVDPGSFARLLVASVAGIQMVSGILAGRRDLMERLEEMWAAFLPGILAQEHQQEAGRLVGLVRGTPQE
ncbi:TetR/AcrR family transcriptional regulator [Arthrobacter sp. MSA 4-2]|uniref:ScbR family autoregulator-binding transcription factor n=1 Tax=Arthrobacter sp. MSA 4-2 TaxID=2794349 RepID=UPI0018E8B425|nr:ScbR family autoregulator-binding transcription factor [Arthrobacter sp. MSA 4-2]MBJ2119526.1 TetR/AcrR family transcriptional regulator [Arthrobacter sp. MSA 4-2]